MPLRSDARDILSIIAYLGRWTLLVLPLGILVGAACAFFLWALALAPSTLKGASARAAGESYEPSETAALVEYVGVERAIPVPLASFVGTELDSLAFMGTPTNDPSAS